MKSKYGKIFYKLDHIRSTTDDIYEIKKWRELFEESEKMVPLCI